MYKIIKVTDREGNIKEEFMKQLMVDHPTMIGKLLYPLNRELVDAGMMRLCFIWTDNSNKVLRTSIIQDYTQQNKTTVVTTENSVYTLERME